MPDQQPDAGDRHLDDVFGLLRALGIREVSYSLDGYGDSGDSTLDSVLYTDDREQHALPNLPIGFGYSGQIRRLTSSLDDIVTSAPEGNWFDNEGGFGSVVIRPFEANPAMRVDCDMTYREDGDYGDGDQADEEDENFDEVITPGISADAIPPLPTIIIGEARP
jgi:hypothetical protein